MGICKLIGFEKHPCCDPRRAVRELPGGLRAKMRELISGVAQSMRCRRARMWRCAARRSTCSGPACGSWSTSGAASSQRKTSASSPR